MKDELDQTGFVIIESVYAPREVDQLLALLQSGGVAEKFGVREFLSDPPAIAEKVFTDRLRGVIAQISPNCSHSIKSIYFDKPPNANWVVNWHQDLTINLSSKRDTPGYKNWRVGPDRTIVQPDIGLLESIFTIRIHLDDCTAHNGALRIIEGSHRRGVIEMNEWVNNKEGKEIVCEVQRGGVLIMKPLALHASKRAENNARRRVIHVEFTDQQLPPGLEWKERINFWQL